MQIITCPSLPYWGHIPEAVHPGTAIQIDGHIHHHCNKFEINLYCGNETGCHAESHSNIALQLRPKLSGKKVICNSRHYGNWSHKEKHRNFHLLHHGSNFSLTVIVEHQFFRVIINGQTVCTYAHRLPLHEIRVLNIEGNVDVSRIEYKHGHQQVIPSAPYPSAPVYPSQPVYNTSQPVYNTSQPVYPSVTGYPAPQTVYVPQPYVQQIPYVQPTVVIDSHHHHGHHGHHGHGLLETIFGHDHHHDHHHHGHHGHHGHHW